MGFSPLYNDYKINRSALCNFAIIIGVLAFQNMPKDLDPSYKKYGRTHKGYTHQSQVLDVDPKVLIFGTP